jgi:hypothetical protein
LYDLKLAGKLFEQLLLSRLRVAEKQEFRF